MARSIRRKATFAGLGLAGAAGLLSLALAGPGIALADPSDPAPAGSAAAAAPTKPDHEAKQAERRDKLAEALAKELGLDKEKVRAALDKVEEQAQSEAKAQRIAQLKTRLDAAVADGKLTREQADAILKAAESGVLPGGPGMGGRGPGGHGAPGRGPGR